MLKKISVVLPVLFGEVVLPVAADISAGSEFAFRLFHPDLLTGAGSTAGGGLFSVTPGDIAVNPALTAGEQRVMLNLGYTMLIQPEQGISADGAGLVSLLIPTRRGVFTGSIFGLSSELDNLYLNQLIGLRGAFAKDITDNLYVGAGLNTGIHWGTGSTDWALALDIGFMYWYGQLGFIQDVRFGAALVNIGKPYRMGFPGICTPRVGIAGTLLTVADGNVAAGFSADISIPQFSNLEFNTGVQLQFARMVTVKTAWQFNLRENIAGYHNLIPAVGVTVKFGIHTQNELMTERGWQQSEITTSGAWQNLYNGVHAVSAGAAINLGLKDEEAPEIILWGED